MKMKAEHFDKLKRDIDGTLAIHNPEGELVACYESGDFHNADKVKELQQRFCFDLLYGAGLNKWVCDELYPYLNDEHIYTALKKVCPQITRRY